MADCGYNTYELHKTHGALNLALQPDLVILSAAKDLSPLPVCHPEPISIITHASADWRCNALFTLELSGTSNLALRLLAGGHGNRE